MKLSIKEENQNDVSFPVSNIENISDSQERSSNFWIQDFQLTVKTKIIFHIKFLTTKTQDRKTILGSTLTRSRTNQEDGIKYKIG